MAEYPGIVLTNTGLDMIAESQTGKSLIFTKLQIGDGVLETGESISTLTALKSSKLDIPIQGGLNQGNGQVRLRYLVDNSGVPVNQGFFAREVGLYAKLDASGAEKLYGYANGGNKVDWIPDKNTPMDAQIFDIFVLIGNASNVTFAIDKSVTYATLLDLEEHKTATPLDHPDGSVTDIKIGNRTITDTTAATNTTGALTTKLSQLGYMIKNITGKASWYTAPVTTIEAINTLFGTSGHTHTGVAGQGPKISAANVTSTATGNIAATNVQAAIAELDSEKQPFDATLTALAGVTTAADKLIYATGSDAFSTTALTAFARTLVDDSDAATARTTLGALGLAGGTMTGPIAMGNKKITGLADGSTSGDAIHYGQFGALISSNGYQKLPTGLILQWGSAQNIPIDAAQHNIVFPVTFPSAILGAGATIQNADIPDIVVCPYLTAFYTNYMTATVDYEVGQGYSGSGKTTNVLWWAIGV